MQKTQSRPSQQRQTVARSLTAGSLAGGTTWGHTQPKNGRGVSAKPTLVKVSLLAPH